MANDDNRINGRELLSNAVLGGAVGVVGYGLYWLARLWSRNEDGPAGRWGLGFGKGNAGINVNPLDMGKAATGDGEGDVDGQKWERAQVAGVEGWQRKGIPLFKEIDGERTYQIAVLIMGDGDTIPDVSGWPDELGVFFVSNPDAPYPLVDGGWLIDATLGNRLEPPGRTMTCRAKTSDELRQCMQDNLESSLPGVWL